MVRQWLPEELAKVKSVVGGDVRTYEQAARVLLDLVCTADFAEFLTLPLYEQLDDASAESQEKQDAYA
jgi:malate synthase